MRLESEFPVGLNRHIGLIRIRRDFLKNHGRLLRSASKAPCVVAFHGIQSALRGIDSLFDNTRFHQSATGSRAGAKRHRHASRNKNIIRNRD
jgi:hypothetical protein